PGPTTLRRRTRGVRPMRSSSDDTLSSPDRASAAVAVSTGPSVYEAVSRAGRHWLTDHTRGSVARHRGRRGRRRRGRAPAARTPCRLGSRGPGRPPLLARPRSAAERPRPARTPMPGRPPTRGLRTAGTGRPRRGRRGRRHPGRAPGGRSRRRVGSSGPWRPGPAAVTEVADRGRPWQPAEAIPLTSRFDSGPGETLETAAMYETSDIRKGLKVLMDGNPFVVVESQFVK